MRRALLILLPLLGITAAMLYIFLDPPTATFFLVAGIVVSLCAASTTLLGAYSRNKEIARQQDRDATEIVPAPGTSNHPRE